MCIFFMLDYTFSKYLAHNHSMILKMKAVGFTDFLLWHHSVVAPRTTWRYLSCSSFFFFNQDCLIFLQTKTNAVGIILKLEATTKNNKKSQVQTVGGVAAPDVTQGGFKMCL